ncbi:sphingosine-1-phosphate phosphatase 1 [Pygocentrus nattereri]|uniref:Phosphatidic acid phosphatase type 2/haloperoxidase domain-containing protein n=1 Tax=Pygocentrus nattereri TaxID=42514 RepID=A0A3B4DBQ1_PYGNA|nr:sphingosine-1-phosphate phosphatase 1 [Pygocentrus nattereri]
MASAVIQRVICLCNYLQDPYHVARFQQRCGVKGTFPRKSPETEKEAGELELSPNGACMRRGQEEGEQGVKGPQLRKSANTSVRKSENIHGSPNGAAAVSSTDTPDGENAGPTKSSSGLSDAPRQISSSTGGKKGDSRGRVKPLRKNSLTGDIGQEFIIENKFLFYLFTVGTELGNEMFFIVFFPFLMWNVDAYVTRQVIVVWVWVLFFGQSTKDLVGWTRPASPPVVKVEVFYNFEYSMPSVHAMTGTSVPFCLFLLTYNRWEYPFLFGLSVAIGWSFLVCISRIYMGMHSVLEVIVGFLYSLLILAAFHPVLDVIDTFYLSSSSAPLVILLLHVGLALVAFSLDSWSTSRGDTAQALATGAGGALACHLNHQLGLQPDPPLSSLPLKLPVIDRALLGRSLLRLLVGVTVLLAVRAVMKAVAIPLACRLFGVPSDDVRKARQNANVELTYRFLVYGTVAFCCVFLVPLFFDYLNLS